MATVQSNAMAHGYRRGKCEQMPVIDFYERYYTAVQSSAAHARFCSRMADMPQIDCLVRMLGLKPSERLLDLGCGDGSITEYIQAATGAAATGVDLSAVAIGQAIQRTAGSAGRLVFRVADMRGLDYPPGAFDAIVLIDSHYFIEDLEGLLGELLGMLGVQGRIGLFSDEGSGIPGRDDSQTDAMETRIGQLLAKEGLRFEALNLTKQNRDHWRLKQKVLLQLKDDFLREGSLFLYENRLKECTCTDRDLDSRFLFLIHNEKNGGSPV